MIIPNNPIGNRKFSKIETVSYTTSGNKTYTVQAGTTHVQVEMWGGGGGGAGGSAITGRGGNVNYSGSGGGGSGAYTYILLTENFKKGDEIKLTVGTGGTAGNFEEAGGDGGNTTLNTYERSGSTLVTYTSKIAGGGMGGRVQPGTAPFGGDGGVTTGGISPSSNGNTGGEPCSSINSACSCGGSGGTAVMTLNATGSSGGVCNNTAAADATDNSGGGGGGLHGPAASDVTGGTGKEGKIIITAWGYFPPVPTDPNLS